MPYIYKIVNDINQKCYIGKTTSSIEKRWNEHCRDSRKTFKEKRPLYSAIKKYGIENFHIEQVEECSLSVLSEREIYWIETLGTFKNGYNATIGGDGNPYIDRQLVLELYEKYKNSKVVAEMISISPESVRKILKENNLNIKYLSSLKFGVVMLDAKTSNPLKAFASCADAARWLIDNGKSNCKENGLRSHISDACNGKRNIVATYKWEKLCL